VNPFNVPWLALVLENPWDKTHRNMGISPAKPIGKPWFFMQFLGFGAKKNQVNRTPGSLWFMILVASCNYIANGVYKPTYNWGGPLYTL